MINYVDDALRKLLLSGLPESIGKVEVAFDQPSREWSAYLQTPVLNLYLYSIRENTELRTSQQVVRQDLPDGKTTVLSNRIARVDLCYLLTAWTKEVQDEHLLLSLALLVLLQNPLLPADKLPIPMRVDAAQGESISDIADLWTTLDNVMHPAIGVKVTLAIEPYALEIATLVKKIQVDFQQEGVGPGESSDKSDTIVVDSQRIVRGTIRSEKYSLSILKMTVEESGKEVEIRDDGQFVIPQLKEGEVYNLVIRANERIIKLQPIKVRSTRYEIQV